MTLWRGLSCCADTCSSYWAWGQVEKTLHLLQAVVLLLSSSSAHWSGWIEGLQTTWPLVIIFPVHIALQCTMVMNDKWGCSSRVYEVFCCKLPMKRITWIITKPISIILEEFPGLMLCILPVQKLQLERDTTTLPPLS